MVSKIQINRLLLSKGIRLYMKADHMADLHAAGGLAAALHLFPGQILLKKIGRQITLKKAKQTLPNFYFTETSKKLKKAILVNWDTEGPVRFAEDGSVTATYDPFKYFLKQRPLKSKKRLRREMRIASGRKIIVLICTATPEVRVVLKAWKKIKKESEPLLIIALRTRDPLLKNLLRREGVEVLNRKSVREPLSGFGKAQVIVLHTAGELTDLLPAADLAIVGHDRNLFEPAVSETPVLYFKRPLKMRRSETRLAEKFSLFWRKNRTAKKLLDRYQGAVPVQMESLPRQIKRILEKPALMIRGVRQAVRVMNGSVRAKAGKVFTAQLILAIKAAT